jgi:hypothetical protein
MAATKSAFSSEPEIFCAPAAHYGATLRRVGRGTTSPKAGSRPRRTATAFCGDACASISREACEDYLLIVVVMPVIGPVPMPVIGPIIVPLLLAAASPSEVRAYIVPAAMTAATKSFRTCFIWTALVHAIKDRWLKNIMLPAARNSQFWLSPGVAPRGSSHAPCHFDTARLLEVTASIVLPARKRGPVGTAEALVDRDRGHDRFLSAGANVAPGSFEPAYVS